MCEVILNCDLVGTKRKFGMLMNHVGENDFQRTGEYNEWNPCFSMDALLFTWTSMISVMQVQKKEVEGLRTKPIVKKYQVSVFTIKQFSHHDGSWSAKTSCCDKWKFVVSEKAPNVMHGSW